VVWHSMKMMEEERCEPRLNTEFTGHVIISCDIAFKMDSNTFTL